MKKIFAAALVAIVALSAALYFSTREPAPTPKEVVSVPQILLKTTAYNPVSEQTDGDPSITASGVPSNPRIAVARSRDLAELLPYGTIIALEPPMFQSVGCNFSSVSNRIGYRVVLDAMASRKRNQIDIMFGESDIIPFAGEEINPAKVLGVCEGMRIRIVGFVDPSHAPRTQKELARRIEGNYLAAN